MQGASAGNPGYLLYRKHNNSGLLVPFAEVKLLLIKGVTEPIVSKYGIQRVSTGSPSYQYFMLGKGIDVQDNNWLIIWRVYGSAHSYMHMHPFPLHQWQRNCSITCSTIFQLCPIHALMIHAEFFDERAPPWIILISKSSSLLLRLS